MCRWGLSSSLCVSDCLGSNVAHKQLLCLNCTYNCLASLSVGLSDCLGRDLAGNPHSGLDDTTEDPCLAVGWTNSLPVWLSTCLSHFLSV